MNTTDGRDSGVKKGGKTADKTAKEQYLKVPYHILNIAGLGLCEKMLLAHIYSFGAKGCWQSNQTLGAIFFVGQRTISRWLGEAKKHGHVLWLHPKGRYRTLWAKSHPDVRAAATLSYMGEQISKEAVVTGRAAAILLRQNCPGGIDKSVVATTTNQCSQVRQNCPPTNNTTKKETTGATIAPPSPLPAGGQAPAVLAQRRTEAARAVEEFKIRFGLGRKLHQPLSEQEFQNRRQQQRDALMALQRIA